MLSNSSNMSPALYFWIVTAQMFSFYFVLYNMREKGTRDRGWKREGEACVLAVKHNPTVVILKCQHTSDSLESLIQRDCWAHSRVSDSIGLGRTWKCEFLTRSQVMLMLVALRSHLENTCNEIVLITLKLLWSFFLIWYPYLPLRGHYYADF